MPQEPFFTILKNRGKVIISGPDRYTFLQGLITNDIYKLGEKKSLLYSCLLTPQGKFLYDFFISEEENNLILDCEGHERAENLEKVLSMYKLRANITFAHEKHTDVFAIFGAPRGLADPRHSEMGYRSFEKPENVEERSFDSWDVHRIKLCIPDGSRDMIQKNSTLLECHIDKLNGVSFDKGCYMGQELTARTHYRGLIKKHLYTVTPDMLDLDCLPAFGEPIERQGKIIGEMRSSCENIGLALLKDEAL